MLGETMHASLLIRGGRVIDPYSGRDEVADILIAEGRYTASRDISAKATVLDATGRIVCPGLMDIHVHLREPGQGHKETIASGTSAAAAGGFTYVVCMPNTAPPVDSPDIVRWIRQHAADVGHCDVGPVAAITRGRAGRELTDFRSLMAAGAVAFSDDGTGVEDDAVMRAAFEEAARLNALIVQHCEYKSLSAGGVMHLGDVSRRLGLPGLDPVSEEAMIERDIDQCRRTGARYHVAHISTAKAVELVRRARAEGLRVTTEVCTHHLLLTDEACAAADPNTKMHPPLRPWSDVEACRRGLVDGTIDCIVTDHAPHAAEEKGLGFLRAPAGIVGLETAVGVAAEAMISSGLADWPRLIGWFTIGASRVLQRDPHPITPGRQANLTILDPDRQWTVDPSRFESKSRNTPFGGRTLIGDAVATVMSARGGCRVVSCE